MVDRGGGVWREIRIHSYAMSFLDTTPPPPPIFRWENIYMGWVNSGRFDNLGNIQDHFAPGCKNVSTLTRPFSL